MRNGRRGERRHEEFAATIQANVSILGPGTGGFIARAAVDASLRFAVS